MRTKGTAAELEVRRRIAARLFTEDVTLAEIARCVDASVSSVRRWKQAWKTGGGAALAAKPHPGPPPKLSVEQQEQLCDLLVAGARAAGYDTDLWTCRRVAALIQDRFGISYHFNHVGRVLHALGFSPQQPLRRARERDEEAIERWRQGDWPRIKKRDADSKPASCSSTKPAFFCSR
jgi:transposase